MTDLPVHALDPRIVGPARVSFQHLSHAQQLQYTAFMGWCNFWLERAQLPVLSDLSVDLCNGTTLASLLELLSGKPVPNIRYSGSAKEHSANLEACFVFLRGENVLLLHIIQPQDIRDGKLTSVFALIWALIVHYGILKPLSHEESSPNEYYSSASGPISLATARKLLVRRVTLFLTHQGTTASPKTGKKAKSNKKRKASLRVTTFNFEAELESGGLFTSLIAKVKPRLVAVKGDKGGKRKDKKNDAPDAGPTLDASLRILRRKWGVPTLFTEADYAASLREKKPVMAYITLCLHALRPTLAPATKDNIPFCGNSSGSSIMVSVGSGMVVDATMMPGASGAPQASISSDAGRQLMEDRSLRRSNSAVALKTIRRRSRSVEGNASDGGTNKLLRSRSGILLSRSAVAPINQQEPPEQHQTLQPAKTKKARKKRSKTLDDRPRRRKRDKTAEVAAQKEESSPETPEQGTATVVGDESEPKEALVTTIEQQPPASIPTISVELALSDAAPPAVSDADSSGEAQEPADEPLAFVPDSVVVDGSEQSTESEQATGTKHKHRKEGKSSRKDGVKTSAREEKKLRRASEPTESVEVPPVEAESDNRDGPKEGSSGLMVGGLLRKKDKKERGSKNGDSDEKKKAKKAKKKKGSKLSRLISRPRTKSRADTLEAGWIEQVPKDRSPSEEAPPSVGISPCVVIVEPHASGDTATFTQKLEALARVLFDQRHLTQTELHKKRFEEMEKTIEQVVALVQAELEVWRKLRLAASENSLPTAAQLDQASYESSVRRALQELVVAEKEVKRVVAISPLISSSTSLHPLWKQVLDSLQQLVDEIKAEAGTASLRRRRDKGTSIPPVSIITYAHLNDSGLSSTSAGSGGGGIARGSGSGTPRTDTRSELNDPKRLLSVKSMPTAMSENRGSSKLHSSTTAGEKSGALLRLRSFNSTDEADRRLPRSPESSKGAREHKAKQTSFVRSNTNDTEKTPSPASWNSSVGSSGSNSDIHDKDRDRFWRNVRSANNGKRGNGFEEPLVVTLCKQNIRGSLQLLQSDVLTDSAYPTAREAGRAKALLDEATLLLFDLESVEGVLDKLFLGFSSVESLKVHSLADLNDFSKTVYNFVCLLKSVERAFQQSLLDFRLRSSDTDLTCDKLAERNACNLSIWKAIIRDSGSLLEETVLLLDSIRQNNVVKTMRLNAWQNLREKVALQVNRLRLDIKKAAPLSTLSARGAKSEVSEDIMRMVEKEIAGLEVEVREEKEAVEATVVSSRGETPREADLPTEDTEATAREPSQDESAAGLPSENEQMNEIWDFLSNKLANSGLARSRLSLLIAMPTTPPPPPSNSSTPSAAEPVKVVLTPPTSLPGSSVAVFHPVPDVSELPPPPEEDDGADYFDVDEQPENQKMNDIFSKLQSKLTNDGIQLIPPTPRFISSCEQAIVSEIIGSESEDSHPLCAQATLFSPPSIEMLPSPRLIAKMALSQRLAANGAPLAAVSSQLYHARLLPSRKQEQEDADASDEPRPPASARGGRLDMCAGCKRHIPDELPRLLALGRVYHQPCLVCAGCKRLLEREFYAREKVAYCRDCLDLPKAQLSSPPLPDVAP